MRNLSVICDQCKSAERKENNHWFGIRLLKPQLDGGNPAQRMKDIEQLTPHTMIVSAWSPTGEYDKEICGEKCLIAATAEFAEQLRKESELCSAQLANS